MGSIGLAHLKIRYFIQTGGRVYSKWIMCLSLKGRQTISNNKFPRLGQSSKMSDFFEDMGARVFAWVPAPPISKHATSCN